MAWAQAETTTDSGAVLPAVPLSAVIANEDLYWRWSLLQSNDTGNWEIILHRYNEVNFPQCINLTNHPARDVEAKFNYGRSRSSSSQIVTRQRSTYLILSSI
ncbi:MAG: hypothetical protein R2867_22065 [Caldilineaceae bacterium]